MKPKPIDPRDALTPEQQQTIDEIFLAGIEIFMERCYAARAARIAREQAEAQEAAA